MSQKVAIFGFGVEGKSAYRYYTAQGADVTIFYKRRPEGVPDSVKVVEEMFATTAPDYDIVVRSPATDPKKIRTNGRITTNVKEFISLFGTERLIGVTGSKGKGTISTLIYDMLRAAGKRVHLAGNIGVPALDLLADIQKGDHVVLELSSFQLWDLEQSPHIAVVGMIVPDHLDIHVDLQDYLSAKANITRHQKAEDFVTYHPTNEHTKWIVDQSPATTKQRYASPEAAHVEDGSIVIDGQQICPVDEIQVPGKHNLENVCAALSAAWQVTQDVTALGQAIRDFKGLEHRIEFVRTIDGVDYYDDSFAANGGATEVAVQTFEAPKVLILGGYDRGLDLQPLVNTIAAARYRKVLLIGQTAPRLAEAFAAAGKAEVAEIVDAATMKEIVARARAVAQSGDIVLLSPGCASFDMFKDYKVRGDEFKKEVNAL